MATGRSDPSEEALLRFLRRQPRSTAALREWMTDEPGVTVVEAERRIEAARNAGLIAFANGEWYVIGAGRLQRAKRVREPDPRQLGLFEEERHPQRRAGGVGRDSFESAKLTTGEFNEP